MFAAEPRRDSYLLAAAETCSRPCSPGLTRSTAHRNEASGFVVVPQASRFNSDTRPSRTSQRKWASRASRPTNGCAAGGRRASRGCTTAPAGPLDDHSRLAYSEIYADEKVATCAGFLTRAAAFFHAHGITRIERILTDNAWAYRKGLAWKQALAEIGATGKLTRIYRPQTNGKVERFHRTLLDEWACLRPFTSNHERTGGLTDFLHAYNYHRCHTALGGQPPSTRVNNPAGQYTYGLLRKP